MSLEMSSPENSQERKLSELIPVKDFSDRKYFNDKNEFSLDVYLNKNKTNKLDTEKLFAFFENIEAEVDENKMNINDSISDLAIIVSNLVKSLSSKDERTKVLDLVIKSLNNENNPFSINKIKETNTSNKKVGNLLRETQNIIKCFYGKYSNENDVMYETSVHNLIKCFRIGVTHVIQKKYPKKVINEYDVEDLLLSGKQDVTVLFKEETPAKPDVSTLNSYVDVLKPPFQNVLTEESAGIPSENSKEVKSFFDTFDIPTETSEQVDTSEKVDESFFDPSEAFFKRVHEEEQQKHIDIPAEIEAFLKKFFKVDSTTIQMALQNDFVTFDQIMQYRNSFSEADREDTIVGISDKPWVDVIRDFCEAQNLGQEKETKPKAGGFAFLNKIKNLKDEIQNAKLPEGLILDPVPMGGVKLITTKEENIDEEQPEPKVENLEKKPSEFWNVIKKRYQKTKEAMAILGKEIRESKLPDGMVMDPSPFGGIKLVQNNETRINTDILEEEIEEKKPSEFWNLVKKHAGRFKNYFNIKHDEGVKDFVVTQDGPVFIGNNQQIEIEEEEKEIKPKAGGFAFLNSIKNLKDEIQNAKLPEGLILDPVPMGGVKRIGGESVEIKPKPSLDLGRLDLWSEKEYDDFYEKVSVYGITKDDINKEMRSFSEIPSAYQDLLIQKVERSMKQTKERELEILRANKEECEKIESEGRSVTGTILNRLSKIKRAFSGKNPSLYEQADALGKEYIKSEFLDKLKKLNDGYLKYNKDEISEKEKRKNDIDAIEDSKLKEKIINELNDLETEYQKIVPETQTKGIASYAKRFGKSVGGYFGIGKKDAFGTATREKIYVKESKLIDTLEAELKKITGEIEGLEKSLAGTTYTKETKSLIKKLTKEQKAITAAVKSFVVNRNSADMMRMIETELTHDKESKKQLARSGAYAGLSVSAGYGRRTVLDDALGVIGGLGGTMLMRGILSYIKESSNIEHDQTRRTLGLDGDFDTDRPNRPRGFVGEYNEEGNEQPASRFAWYTNFIDEGKEDLIEIMNERKIDIEDYLEDLGSAQKKFDTAMSSETATPFQKAQAQIALKTVYQYGTLALKNKMFDFGSEKQSSNVYVEEGTGVDVRKTKVSEHELGKRADYFVKLSSKLHTAAIKGGLGKNRNDIEVNESFAYEPYLQKLYFMPEDKIAGALAAEDGLQQVEKETIMAEIRKRKIQEHIESIKDSKKRFLLNKAFKQAAVSGVFFGLGELIRELNSTGVFDPIKNYVETTFGQQEQDITKGLEIEVPIKPEVSLISMVEELTPEQTQAETPAWSQQEAARVEEKLFNKQPELEKVEEKTTIPVEKKPPTSSSRSFNPTSESDAKIEHITVESKPLNSDSILKVEGMDFNEGGTDVEASASAQSGKLKYGDIVTNEVPFTPKEEDFEEDSFIDESDNGTYEQEGEEIESQDITDQEQIPVSSQTRLINNIEFTRFAPLVDESAITKNLVKETLFDDRVRVGEKIIEVKKGLQISLLENPQTHITTSDEVVGGIGNPARIPKNKEEWEKVFAKTIQAPVTSNGVNITQKYESMLRVMGNKDYIAGAGKFSRIPVVENIFNEKQEIIVDGKTENEQYFGIQIQNILNETRRISRQISFEARSLPNTAIVDNNETHSPLLAMYEYETGTTAKAIQEGTARAVKSSVPSEFLIAERGTNILKIDIEPLKGEPLKNYMVRLLRFEAYMKQQEAIRNNLLKNPSLLIK